MQNKGIKLRLKNIRPKSDKIKRYLKPKEMFAVEKRNEKGLYAVKK